MTACQLAVQAQILTLDAATVLATLQDPGNGLELAKQIPDPQWDDTAQRTTAVYMNGSTPTSVPTIVDTFIPVVVRVHGATWVQVKQRVAALDTAWRLHDRFLLRKVVEGVTTTYLAEREAWQPEEITPEIIASCQLEVTLLFRVQPNPTEVYA